MTKHLTLLVHRIFPIFLFIGLAWGQDGLNCTASDGTEGVELWGNCYSIETQVLNLGAQEWVTDIPPEIGNLVNLTYLYLAGNDLTGSIPPEIGNLTNLITLRLINSQLTGSIPSEIGNLTNLEGLSLNNNGQLTGSIPPEIGNLTNLQSLGLGYNQLTGSIPPEIGNLSNLTYGGLDNNQLTGEIPESICDLNINSFSVRNNQLCPPYPSCIIVGEQNTNDCPQGVNILYPNVSETFSSHIDSNNDIVFIWDENNLNYNPTYRLTIALDFFNITYTDTYDNIDDTTFSIPANNLDALLAALNMTESYLSWYVDAYYEEGYSDVFASDTGSFYLTRDYLDIHDKKYSPKGFILFPNYPNPFNPTTTLRYELPEDSFVDVTVYDMLGNVVNNLVNTNQSSGYKSIQWNATNNQGEPVSAGVYLYKIQAGDFVDTRKMILLK